MESSCYEWKRLPTDLIRMSFSGFPDNAIFSKYLQFDKEDRKLNSGDVKWFLYKWSYLKFLKLPNVLGIKPKKDISPKLNLENLEALETKLGIAPLKLLPYE